MQVRRFEWITAVVTPREWHVSRNASPDRPDKHIHTSRLVRGVSRNERMCPSETEGMSPLPL